MRSLTPRQRRFLRKTDRALRGANQRGADSADGDLNIVPFLDVVVNLVMFLLMTVTATLAMADVPVNTPPTSDAARVAPGEGGGREMERDPVVAFVDHHHALLARRHRFLSDASLRNNEGPDRMGGVSTSRIISRRRHVNLSRASSDNGPRGNRNRERAGIEFHGTV